MTKAKRPGLFLDRDGTINVDHVYISDPKKIELIPGSAEAIAKAQDAGYVVVVVTNQSGVGRGIIQLENLPLIHRRLGELLSEKNAFIDDYQICVHRPEENCDCRKPSPKLVRKAAAALGIDLSISAFVGDRLSDVGTGKNSGCRYSILVRTGKGREEENLLTLGPAEQPDLVAEDLASAVDWLLAQSAKS